MSVPDDMTAEEIDQLTTAWFRSLTDEQISQFQRVLTPEQFAPLAEVVRLVREGANQ